MTKIELWTAMVLDWGSLEKEASRLNKTLTIKTDEGLRKIFFIDPDLLAGEKTKINSILSKMGDVTVT